jgi:hypothetical protein
MKFFFLQLIWQCSGIHGSSNPIACHLGAAELLWECVRFVFLISLMILNCGQLLCSNVSEVCSCMFAFVWFIPVMAPLRCIVTSAQGLLLWK